VLYLDPPPLVVSDVDASNLFAVFDLVKVVDDDSDKQVQKEDGANDHEEAEENRLVKGVGVFGLHVHAEVVNGSIHGVHRTLRGHHFELREKAVHSVVEVLSGVDPRATQVQAISSCIDHLENGFVCQGAGEEYALEEIYSHNAEDEQEQEDDDQHICHCWHGREQCVDYDFQTFVSGNHPKWSKGSERSESFE
jgi:hypothetical protein